MGAAVVSRMEGTLREEEEDRNETIALLNERLYEQEQRSCDWFVEKKLLETQLKESQQQLQQRDELESHIETRMYSLFARLKQLEDDNMWLEQQVESQNSPASSPARSHNADVLVLNSPKIRAGSGTASRGELV